MLAMARNTAVWRFLRGWKRLALPPQSDERLQQGHCRAEVSILSPPVALEAEAPFTLNVKIVNHTGRAWSTRGRFPIRLRSTWQTHRGESFEYPILHDLPVNLYPGEPETIPLLLTAPRYVGDYLLEVELIQDNNGRFSGIDPESLPAQVAIPVQGKRATDIDYHSVYRTADLENNHWWVVGAYHSREEYERSSQERLTMLQKQGLTPDSRVLDVGCGTGQMAGVLMPFLNERGCYCGTDIGKEAIAFCQRSFLRENFHFRIGEMTHIPFTREDGPFDCVIFFSVFTHTFIDETALLLAEVAEALARGGSIIADVITSPLVERGAGHRGEMVVNREYFLRFVHMLGLQAEVIGRWPWNPHAERLMYRLRRPS